MEPEPTSTSPSAPAPSSTQGASPGPEQTGEGTSKKRSLKRKKSRQSVPDYTVEEGEDMLLIISNTNQYTRVRPKCPKGKKKTATKRKAEVRTKHVPSKAIPRTTPIEKVEQEDGFDRWGQGLPVEVLANIFQMVVNQDGAIPFLCRAARVCQLWNSAAASPALWRSVSVGWTAQGNAQPSQVESRNMIAINWLAQNRFSQLNHFSLNHWKKQVDYAMEVVSRSCPHLQSLKLSYCNGVTTKSFENLGENCQSLQSIDLQYSEFQVEGFVSFLESHGARILQLRFTYGSKIDKLLAALSRGVCPELELLEINTKLNSGYCQLAICIQGLQYGCPRLQTFRLLNIVPLYKAIRNGPECTTGFPLLEELCMATGSMSTTRDQDLRNILYSSSKLRVLDLRGCYGITADGLAALPCEELECLFWGLYCTSKTSSSVSKKGLHLLTQKWSGTLREMDLSNQPFSDNDMEIAMGHLAQGTGAEYLRSLNLSGTTVTVPALRLIIGQATVLNYLNLSSCRHLPRGLKRVYRGREDICQLLDNLP